MASWDDPITAAQLRAALAPMPSRPAPQPLSGNQPQPLLNRIPRRITFESVPFIEPNPYRDDAARNQRIAASGCTCDACVEVRQATFIAAQTWGDRMVTDPTTFDFVPDPVDDFPLGTLDSPDD
jgi:hypothetical protein